MMTPLTPFAPFAPFMDRPVQSGPSVPPAIASTQPLHDSRFRLIAAQPAGAPAAKESGTQLRVPTPIVPFPTPALALARLAAGGDRNATRRLLVLISPRVGRVVRAILGGAHPDIDDVTQQSLLGFVRALPAFRGDCEPMQFASRIAARTAIAAARRARTLRARRDDEIELDMLSAEDANPDAATAERRASLVRTLLDRIPREQADTLVMRVMLGWSLGEVASATGVPVNTVRSRMRLAKNAMIAAMASVPGALEELGPMDPSPSDAALDDDDA